jgi:hypothetical protein
MDPIYPIDRLTHVHIPSGLQIQQLAVFSNDLDLPRAGREQRLRIQMFGLGFDAAYCVENRIESVETITAHRYDRFVDLFDALSKPQLDALALSVDRVGLVVECGKLYALIAAGDLRTARELGASCFERICELFAVSPLGEGKIGRAIVRDHATLARLCERAIAALLYDAAEAAGRLRQVLCDAAELSGGPREVHETRSHHAQRRTAFAALSSTLPKVELPFGVVHPATWPVVAARLGTTIEAARKQLWGPDDDADDRLDDEDDGANDERIGPRAFESQLGDLLVRSIPLIPEDERPELYFPAASRYASTTQVDDPLSAYYKALNARITRVARLNELDAPDTILDAEAAALQRTVDQLAAAANAPLELASIDGWGLRSAPRPIALWTPTRDPELCGEGPSDEPPSLVWLSDDRIAIARADVASIISLSQRRVLRTIPIGPVRLQACDDAGRLVITTANSMQWYRDALFGFGCFDSDTGEWLSELPGDIPAVSFGKDQPEDGYLYEHRIGGCFSLSECDRPTALAWSRGNRAVWLSGDYSDIYYYGVRSTETCVEEISSNALFARCEHVQASVLRADGKLVGDGELGDAPEPRPIPMYAAAPCAFGRSRDRWMVLTPSLHVADLDRTRFRLGFPIDAAGFSPDARRLAVLDDELRIIDVADRAIIWRASLGDLG